MTRDFGARCLTTCRLWRSAALSIVALTIGVTRASPRHQHTELSPKNALGIRFRRVIFELGVLTQEGELHIAGRTVALLGDDDIGDAFARGVRLVNFFAINEQNQVAILLNAARFAKIRHHGLLLDPLFDAAIELR